MPAGRFSRDRRPFRRPWRQPWPGSPASRSARWPAAGPTPASTPWDRWSAFAPRAAWPPRFSSGHSTPSCRRTSPCWKPRKCRRASTPCATRCGSAIAYVIHDGPVRDVFLRRYCWQYPYGRLDAEAMHRAAGVLRGRHDFAAFQTSGAERRTSVRTIFDLAVRRGEGGLRHTVSLEVEADGFLYNMVRTIVGTLVEVGRGARPESWVADVLAAADRRAAGPTAPPQGLFLVSVHDGYFDANRPRHHPLDPRRRAGEYAPGLRGPAADLRRRGAPDHRPGAGAGGKPVGAGQGRGGAAGDRSFAAPRDPSLARPGGATGGSRRPWRGSDPTSYTPTAPRPGFSAARRPVAGGAGDRPRRTRRAVSSVPGRGGACCFAPASAGPRSAAMPLSAWPTP